MKMKKLAKKIVSKQIEEEFKPLFQSEQLRALLVDGICNSLKELIGIINEKQAEDTSRNELCKRLQGNMSEEELMMLAEEYCDKFFSLSKNKGKKK